MSRNVLDLKKSHQLLGYLKDNAEQLKDLTLSRVAEMAAESLGFTITSANITNIRDTFDLDLGRQKQQAPAHDQQIDDLRAQIAELNHKVALLYAQVRRHIQHVDEPITNDVSIPRGTEINQFGTETLSFQG